MANGDQSRVEVNVEVLLRNLRRVDELHRKLLALSRIKVGGTAVNPAAIDKAALAAQRLSIQQQELTNRQERARITAAQLEARNERLNRTIERTSKVTGQAADAHVRYFRALQNGGPVNRQADAHVKAFRAIQQEAKALGPAADAHVRFFRAQQQSLPLMDAHVVAFRRIEGEAQRFTQTLGRIGGTLRNVGLGLTSLGASLSVALTAPLTALGVATTTAAVNMESLRLGLKTVAGSSAEAETQLARLTEIAKLPGIGFQEAIQGSIRLQAIGVSAEVAERGLRAFSNAVALTGGGRENLDRVLVQLTQLIAKGKVLQQDLKFILENAPTTGEALRDVFGTIDPQQIEALGLTTEQFLDKLFTGLEGLPRAAQGTRNALDNFADALFRVGSTIGEAILPPLTQFLSIAEPVITTLASAFRTLPTPLQQTAIAFGLVAATAGPLLFVFGQMSTGIGGLISGYGRVAAALGVATGAQTAFNVAVAKGVLLTGGIVAAVAVLGALAFAVSRYYNAAQKLPEVTEEQVRATQTLTAGYQRQLSFLKSLSDGVARTAGEQQKLRDAYQSIAGPARLRAEAIDKERGNTVELRAELERLIRLRQEEQRLQSLTAASAFAQSAVQLAEANARADRLTRRIEQLGRAREQLERATAPLSRQQIEALQLPDLFGAGRERQLEILEQVIGRLSVQYGDLKERSKELNGTLEQQAQVMRALGAETPEQIRRVLQAAKAWGLFKGDVDQSARAIEEFLRELDKVPGKASGAAAGIDAVTAAFRRMQDAGRDALDADRQLVEGARAFVLTFARNADEARRLFDALVARVPALAGAVERLRRKEGLGDALQEHIFGKKGGRGEKDLRSAAEAFANAAAEEVEAAIRRETETQKAANDRLLELNQFRYDQELIGLTAFLAERQRLLQANLDLEIREQRAAAERAAAARDAALARSRDPKVNEGERQKEEADAQRAETKRLDAEANINRLTAERGEIEAETGRDLEVADKERIKRFREIRRELQALTNQELTAADAAVDEKFLDDLRALKAETEAVETALAKARADGKKSAVTDLEFRLRQLGLEKETIDALIAEEKQRNKIADSFRKASEAQETFNNRQEQIRQAVELEGITRQEALRRRLEDEEALKAELQKQLDVLAAIADKLGTKAPPALVNSIDELRLSIARLGKLSFSEQFREAEEDFTNLQDTLSNKIQDVERRIRTRDLSEVEGRQKIRALNQEYVKQLERQAALLRQIAEESQNDALKRQASQAEQAAKDARAAADELENFDRQLKSVAIDSFNDSLSQLFKDLRDNTESALQDILNFFNRILDRVNDFIAENLAREITESLFPAPGQEKEGGIVGFFKRILGLGGGAEASTDANTTATEQNTEALNALTETFGGKPAESPVQSAKRDPLGFFQKVGGFLGGLFSSGSEDEASDAEAKEGLRAAKEGGGFLDSLFGLFGATQRADAPQGNNIIDALNINSDETANNTLALQENTAALKEGSDPALSSSQGLSGFFDTLFAAEGGFASGGHVPIRVSRREVYIPPKHVRDMGLDFWRGVNSKRLVLGDRPALIDGPGTRTSDSIPALAPPGSFILNADAAEEAMLSSVNSGRGRFALGGMVDDQPASAFVGGGSLDLKQVIVDSRPRFRDEMTTAESRKVLVDVIGEESAVIRRRLGMN